MHSLNNIPSFQWDHSISFSKLIQIEIRMSDRHSFSSTYQVQKNSVTWDVFVIFRQFRFSCSLNLQTPPSCQFPLGLKGLTSIVSFYRCDANDCRRFKSGRVLLRTLIDSKKRRETYVSQSSPFWRWSGFGCISHTTAREKREIQVFKIDIYYHYFII